jgi:hypothetical protein
VRAARLRLVRLQLVRLRVALRLPAQVVRSRAAQAVLVAVAPARAQVPAVQRPVPAAPAAARAAQRVAAAWAVWAAQRRLR